MIGEQILQSLLSRSLRNTVFTVAITSFSAASAQTTPTTGKWQRQLWNGVGGRYVSDLTDSSRFYQAPNSTVLTDSSYSLTGTYFGARSRGYITPTTSGFYTFWVAGDDEVQWLMSSNASNWDARKLSTTSAATTINNWDSDYSQRTEPQFLIAGKSYYVESLHKQGGGSACAAVAWSMQGVDPAVMRNWATPALGATATQSTNFNAGNTASKAIDGNLSTFNYTSGAAYSWLQVDLKQNRPISSIELVNRQDTNQSRLSNFRVSVEDGNGRIVAFKDFYPTTGSVGLTETWTLPETVTGRRVKIRFNGPNRQNNYYLHLAELKAIGPDYTLKNWSREASAVASQSTTYSSSNPASDVNDGDVNSFHHTSNVAGSWVQVDLGADRLVDSVELINRQDGEQNRLSNFRVSILNAANAVVSSSDYNLTSGSVQGALRWELPQAVTGRKVKVTLLGLNRDGNYLLHLAELNVWGRTSSAVTSRGIRELIPATVMSSYVPSLTDDLDDDGIPAAVELANGLDPNNRADPGLDFDYDGIKNLAEIQSLALGQRAGNTGR
jgi:F5/8 type C domain/PA14 domain